MVGGVGSQTASLLESLLKKLQEYEQQLIADGRDEMARMVGSLRENLEIAVKNGMQFSELMLNNMLGVFEDGVTASEEELLGMINNVMTGLNTMQASGSRNFNQLWVDFRHAMEQMNVDQFTVLQNMLNNIETCIWQAGNLMKTISMSEEKGYEIKTYKGGLEIGSVSQYSEGGVIDYTGPAAVHGSKSNPEVVFNADAAAKLYNYVVNTPDLLKSAFASITADSSMLKGASQVNNSPSIGDININIAGNADADTVLKLKQLTTTLKDEVVKSLNESMSRRGISRSPRTI